MNCISTVKLRRPWGTAALRAGSRKAGDDAPPPHAHPIRCRARSSPPAACRSRVPTGPPAAPARPASSTCTWCSVTWPRASCTTGTASGEWPGEPGGRGLPPSTPAPERERLWIQRPHAPGPVAGSFCWSVLRIPTLPGSKLRPTEGTRLAQSHN